MSSGLEREEGQGYTFYHQTGPQARLSNSCTTAERHDARVEFQNAVVMSSGPLEEGRPFQVLIESKVSTWSGSIIVGEKKSMRT
jgi:neuralized-like protein 4